MFFTTLCIAVALLTLLCLVMYRIDDHRHNFLAFLLSIVSGTAAVIGLVVIVFTAYDWFAAEHKARILNAEYGTNYSQQDVFFASSVIETVRQLDRKRIELNGDLMRDKADK